MQCIGLYLHDILRADLIVAYNDAEVCFFAKLGLLYKTLKYIHVILSSGRTCS